MGKLANFFKAQGIPLPEKQRAQMLALDKEYESLEEQKTALQAENLHLKAEVNPLKEENKRLKERLEPKPAKEETDPLDPDAERILVLLARNPGRQLTSPQIQGALGIAEARAEHYLGWLFDRRYISNSINMGGGHARYFLHDKGNEFLVKKGLV